MIKQIQAALDNSENFRDGDLKRFKSILQRYVSGEIGVDDAYYDLLDGDLIPMPSRCGMYTELQKTTDDEDNLKNYINKKLFKK